MSPIVGFLTIGTKTPRAPLSRACLICQLELAEIPVAGILTIGVGPPFGTAPWIAVTRSAAPGTRDINPCSQSITIHERWGLACATVRATKLLGRVSQAPNAGFLAWKSLRSAWETIVDEVKTIEEATLTWVVIVWLCRSAKNRSSTCIWSRTSDIVEVPSVSFLFIRSTVISRSLDVVVTWNLISD